MNRESLKEIISEWTPDFSDQPWEEVTKCPCPCCREIRIDGMLEQILEAMEAQE
jgi:hypothetical protein